MVVGGPFVSSSRILGRIDVALILKAGFHDKPVGIASSSRARLSIGGSQGHLLQRADVLRDGVICVDSLPGLLRGVLHFRLSNFPPAMLPRRGRRPSFLQWCSTSISIDGELGFVRFFVEISMDILCVPLCWYVRSFQKGFSLSADEGNSCRCSRNYADSVVHPTSGGTSGCDVLTTCFGTVVWFYPASRVD